MFKITSTPILSLLVFLFALAITPSHAAMVETPSLILGTQNPQSIEKTRLEIVKQLSDLGVNELTAEQRVAELSDVQIAEISDRIENAPAGASAGGILLTVFIVFVITDVIGATDIFPFIKPVVK